MNRIKELRTKKGWRQQDLAEVLSTNQQTVGRYESEKRGLDVETIGKLCDIFDCTADYLLGRSELRRFSLTPEESELLLGFRELSGEGRAFVLHALALARLGHAGKSGDLPDLEAEPVSS